MKMHEACSTCGFRFEVEPGFFWGAMYISYAFTIAIGLVVGILLYLILGRIHVWSYAGVIGAVLFLLSPLIFRYSRIVMLYAFAPVRYDSRYGD